MPGTCTGRPHYIWRRERNGWEVTHILLDHDADPDARDNDNCTPLHLGVATGPFGGGSCPHHARHRRKPQAHQRLDPTAWGI